MRPRLRLLPKARTLTLPLIAIGRGRCGLVSFSGNMAFASSKLTVSDTRQKRAAEYPSVH